MGSTEYFICKKNIDHVVLIQKNLFLGINENNFLIESDYFYFESESDLFKSIYITSKFKKVVGNFQIENIKNIKFNKIYDLLFIYHPIISLQGHEIELKKDMII